MKSIKPEKEKITITSAVFFSLLIHFAAGVFLFFGISKDVISLTGLNELNPVWVSLDNKSKDSDLELKKAGLQESSPAAVKMGAQTAMIKTMAINPETISISQAKAMNLINVSAPAKHETSVAGEKQSFSNINGRGASETAENKSNLGNVIAYPLYKENAPPVYPEIARVRGYEGIVLVFAEILPTGRVGEIKIRKSSGYAILDQSAIQAVKPWKFEPAKKSGNPFTAWVELPIKFILHNNSQS
jgi:TonB family protein